MDTNEKAFDKNLKTSIGPFACTVERRSLTLAHQSRVDDDIYVTRTFAPHGRRKQHVGFSIWVMSWPTFIFIDMYSMARHTQMHRRTVKSSGVESEAKPLSIDLRGSHYCQITRLWCGADCATARTKRSESKALKSHGNIRR